MGDARAAEPKLPLATRCRLEFLAGLVEGWERRHGRPITLEELRRGLRRYPGDPDEVLRHAVQHR